MNASAETTPINPAANANEGLDFIREIVTRDTRSGRYDGRVATRFPPEPNGYLHIGHAKSICLNFGIAQQFGGVCHLRFDDTNPETEDMAYVESIQRDIRWLGFDWQDKLFFASDYYEQLYQFAVRLIRDGKAYVDSLNEEEIRAHRGTVLAPGTASPHRSRSVAENLDLFARMRAGEFPDGAHVLRAKGDMASPNMKMRDPLLYRIRHAHHYRTGDDWCIYPMYDYAHPLCDAIERITHSICTLEFENNREIYDWLLDNLFEEPRPHQYEFARLNLDYTVMSKRKLLQLVEEEYVAGWDDPRMLTIAGLRRRGVTPEAIRAFSDRIGVAKANSRIDMSLLEYCIRDDLNYRAPRVLCVLRPLKLVVDNYPADQVEELDAPYWPHDVPKEGSRKVPFSRVLYIEEDDFAEEPPKGYRRLAPGQEVRLRYAYVVKCTGVIKDEQGKVVEVHCTYDPATQGGATPDGRRIQGAIHWVSAAHALPAEVRLYDRLFTVPNPDDAATNTAAADGKTFKDYLNPDSLTVLPRSFIEPSVAADPAGSRYQFERQGYFIADAEDARPGALVYNRIVTLRDSWAKATQTPAPAPQTSRPTPQPAEAAQVRDSDGHQEPGEATRRSRTEQRDDTRGAAPELAARLTRYTQELGLPFEDADVLTGDLALARFFEAALAEHGRPQSVAKWVTNELLRETKGRSLDQLPFTAAQFGRLVALVDDNTLTGTLAKQVLDEMLAHGGDPDAIIRQRGLAPISDRAALAAVVARVIAANPEKAEQYRSGKTGLLGFFMGQVMRETQGKANPQLVQELAQTALTQHP